MTLRDNLLKSLRREGWDQLPCDIELTPPKRSEFSKRNPLKTIPSYFGLSHRLTGLLYRSNSGGYGRNPYVGKSLPESYKLDAWGIAMSRGSEAAYHMVHFHSPLEGENTSIETLRDYPLPKPIPGFEFLLECYVRHLHHRGLAAMGSMEQTVWERAWLIRGMPDLMMDMHSGEERAAILLDRITNHSCRMGEVLARTGHDIIALGDDVGMQDTLMMSPELWRRWLKPRLAKVIRTIKNLRPDILIFYHSCGFIEPLIPELIEIGVDILNPVQPESMDFAKIHRLYSERLSFWGGIGTQTTFPFGSPSDVRNKIRELVAICGDRGGLVVGPTHVIEPEVSWENLEAMREEVRKINTEKR